MHDLQKIYRNVLEDILSVGINYGNIKSISTREGDYADVARCNRTEKKTFGMVISTTFDIEVCEWLLKDDIPVQSLKDIIAHEVLHTCEGCFDHTGTWKEYAMLMNRTLGYHIERTTKNIDLGNYTPNYKCAVQCSYCGGVVTRRYETKVIKQPEKYTCPYCNREKVLFRIK
ncbi:MAG: hypothetical protein IJA34_16910 [Lachnospiraceae bacterium]|nr:hypothetical protein [Lachnospiraceae bacterium]